MSTSEKVDVVITVNKIWRKSGNASAVQLTEHWDRPTVNIQRYIAKNHKLKARHKGNAISIGHLQALDSLVRKVFKQAQREGLVHKKVERS